jgi:hypothetical protein
MTVVNKSTQDIATLTVEVCQKKYSFANMPTNSTHVAKYDVDRDSGFKVNGFYKDGRSISNEFGYVTPSPSPKKQPVTIEVRDNGVVVGKQP